MFLIPRKASSSSQITAPVNNVVHSWTGRWDPGRLGLVEKVPDTELSVSNPAELLLGAEMKYGRASHYTETCSSYLVIDGLGEASASALHFGNCLLLWGLGVF